MPDTQDLSCISTNSSGDLKRKSLNEKFYENQGDVSKKCVLMIENKKPVLEKIERTIDNEIREEKKNSDIKLLNSKLAALINKPLSQVSAKELFLKLEGFKLQSKLSSF